MQSSALIKMVQKDGWHIVRTKGSHHHFKHPRKNKKEGACNHSASKKDIPIGTVKSILKQAGVL